MRRVSRRNLAAHKIRLASTVLSVVLGTAFIAGSFVFTDTLQSTFNGIFSDVAKGVDVQVRAKEDSSSGVALADAARIKAIPGVRAVEPVMQGQVVLLGSNGKTVQAGGAPSEGSSYIPPPQRLGDPLTFSAGRGPSKAGEVALNESAAKFGKLAVGDHTKVLVPAQGTVDVTLSGIYASESEAGGYIGVLFTQAQALRLFTDGQHVRAINIAGTGVTQDELRSRVAAALPNLETKTGTEVQDEKKKQISTALSFINYFLLAFGAIALLVGTFIIYNTFSMIVAQRLRELALLRAIGASRRQVSRSVLYEAVIVGMVGSVVGIATGAGLAYGLRALLNHFNVGLPGGTLQLKAHTIITGLTVGIVVTVFSAYVPARRAAKTSPVAAMREEFASTGTSLRGRTILSVPFALIGAAALTAGGLADGGGHAATLVGIGALALIFGVLLGGPALSRPIVAAFGAPTAAPFGAVGRLARTNAVRNPRRTAATAFALTLGLMLVSAIAVFGSSAKQSVNTLIDNGITADYMLTGPDAIGVPVGAGQAASKVDGVATTVTLHPVNVTIDGKDTQGTGVDGTVADVGPFTVKQGSGELVGNSILVSEKESAARHWTLGSTVTMLSHDQRTIRTKVTGIFADNDLLGHWLVTGDIYRNSTPRTAWMDFVVLIKASPGTDLAVLRRNLEAATDRYLVVQIQDREQFKGQQARQINMLLAVLYGLLALAIVIAVLGIINTLALSVVERRREIGMLRAVGMLRPQVRRTIYLESMLIATFGAIVGLALGLTFGTLFVRTLREDGLSSIAVPWGQMGGMLVLSAVVGVLAASWPAIRAARTRPLAAIADI
jgi:putative ABC transport system permease protein